jgi:hypothetical protein
MPHAFEKTFSDVATGSGRAWQGPEAAPRRCFGARAVFERSAKPAVFGLERDGSSLNRHLALSFCLSMIFPENR